MMRTLVAHARSVLVFVAVGALVGASLYSAVFEYVERAKTKQALLAQQNTLSTSGLMRYGIVVATDPANQTISISFPDQFYVDQKRIDETYAIKPGAPITRQTLIGDGTVYTAISEPETISLSDIQTGEHVAIYAPLNADGNLIAWNVIVGDPL